MVVMVKFIIGDLRTGRRIQTLPVIDGKWSETLNAAGDVSCVVDMSTTAAQRLGLYQSASVGKAFLAAVEDDLVLQAGPIWTHDWDDDQKQLSLTASGMWSYFDHRVLIPVLAGRNPSDATTDTRFSAPVTDPTATGYPWPTDTRKTLQGIARYLVWQAQQATGGNVPVILPAEIVNSTNERWYKGADLGIVGQRLQELTQVDGGPDIMFTPRFTSDKLGIEWVMRIGTPTVPLLSSLQRQVFYVGTKKSAVSNLRVKIDGTKMASQTFAAGGRSSDAVLISESDDPTLTNAGYPLLQGVDSSHSSVTEPTTLQGYSDELIAQGRTPSLTLSFDHDQSRRPFLQAYNAGDFADVRVKNNVYLENRTHTMRIMSRSGDATGQAVSLTFFAEVS